MITALLTLRSKQIHTEETVSGDKEDGGGGPVRKTPKRDTFLEVSLEN